MYLQTTGWIFNLGILGVYGANKIKYQFLIKIFRIDTDYGYVLMVYIMFFRLFEKK